MFQHTGDNILQLVRGLSRAPELADDSSLEDEGAVFYDFLGLFLVNYSQRAALIFNVITMIVSFGVALWCLIEFKMGKLMVKEKLEREVKVLKRQRRDLYH